METISQSEVNRLAGDVAATDPEALARAIAHLKDTGDADGLRRLGAALADHARELEHLAAEGPREYFSPLP
jgi:hypothetical protein